MGISFEAALTKINSKNIIKLPLSSSEKLPSRGMIMIQGTMKDTPFKAPLEPDGKGSHWFEVSAVPFTVELLKNWTEPEIPADIMNAVLNYGLLSQWNSLTTKARWEWLRWIRSTRNPETRDNRIDVACSKLQKGARRPCCFDTTRCTITEVSKSGVLED
jgi:hypothetical protein